MNVEIYKKDNLIKLKNLKNKDYLRIEYVGSTKKAISNV